MIGGRERTHILENITKDFKGLNDCKLEKAGDFNINFKNVTENNYFRPNIF